MRTAPAILGAIWLALSVAGTAMAETTRFGITRNGDPIGTSTIEINRAGDDVNVSTVTDLAVNVLFFTAYRIKQTTNEHWNNGHLVDLRSAQMGTSCSSLSMGR